MNGYEFNELKSFNLDAQGSFIKLSFQKPHQNEHNTKGQVYLIYLYLARTVITIDWNSNTQSSWHTT